MKRIFSSNLKKNLFNFRSISQFKFSSTLNKNSNNYDSNDNDNNEILKEVKTENIDPITIDLNENIINKDAEILNTVSNLNIKDVYTIKSKKMGPPDINKIIDRSKITHPGVKLSNFDPKTFSNNEFENKNPIPISPRLGPYEVNLKI